MTGKLDTKSHRYYLTRISKREGMNASFFKSGKVEAPRAKEVQESLHTPSRNQLKRPSALIITYKGKKIILKKGIFLVFLLAWTMALRRLSFKLGFCPWHRMMLPLFWKPEKDFTLNSPDSQEPLSDTLKQELLWFYYCSVYRHGYTPEQIKVNLPKALRIWRSRNYQLLSLSQPY